MTKRKSQTLSEILGYPATFGPSLETLQATYPQVVAEVEAELGPQVPARLQGRGRPAKGTQVPLTRTHSLRIPDSLWERLGQKATQTGITLNQAAQQAFLEWLKH